MITFDIAKYYDKLLRYFNFEQFQQPVHVKEKNAFLSLSQYIFKTEKKKVE